MTKSIIIGTAGHIDHGKTALVKALTGTDTDRLPEEKARGITIDIGFAHMTLAAMDVSFVDVPGHEKFIKNMLAGIGGIDLLLLVVAADESIMPQTREHFAISKLLGIRSGAIVITKKDLVDQETLEVVKIEIHQLVQGSFLENAPLFPVSAKTGEGLDQLKSGLADLLANVEQRQTRGVFRLPIDRVFVLKGHGTVVTGTLVSGEIVKDMQTEILPTHRTLRIRSVHAHNRSVERAYAGQRTAVNLIGIEKEEMKRGDVLTEPDFFENTSLLDVQIELLEHTVPLRHNAVVRFHHLTNDVLARVTLLGDEVLQPGQSSFAQLRLQRPIFAIYNDRFILRKHSPLQTIGGGVILDHQPRRRISRSNVQAMQRLRELEKASPESRLLITVEEQRLLPADEAFLKSKLAMHPDEIRKLEQEQIIVLKEKPLLMILRNAEDEIGAKIKEVTKRFHAENPLLPGVSKEELRSRFFPLYSAEVFDLFLQRMAQRKQIEIQRDSISIYGRKLSLTAEESNEVNRTEQSLRGLGLQGTIEELKAQTKASEEQLKNWLHLLFRQGKVVKITDEYFLHTSIWQELKEKIRALKPGQTRFSVPDFKSLFGVTRKYAIPLLEHLDREGVTRRSGNERIII